MYYKCVSPIGPSAAVDPVHSSFPAILFCAIGLFQLRAIVPHLSRSLRPSTTLCARLAFPCASCLRAAYFSATAEPLSWGVLCPSLYVATAHRWLLNGSATVRSCRFPAQRLPDCLSSTDSSFSVGCSPEDLWSRRQRTRHNYTWRA